MLNSRRKVPETQKQPRGVPSAAFLKIYKSTNLHTVLFVFLNECFVVRGYHRVLFGVGVQVLFDAVYGIHGVLEGADEQIDFAGIGDCVPGCENSGVADCAVGAAFDQMIVIELESHRIPKSDRLFAGEAVIDDDGIRSHSPVLTADRKGNGFDFTLAIGTEGADLGFQKQRSAVVAESFHAVLMRAQFIAAAGQRHAVCDGQQFVRLLDRRVAASRKENLFVAERVQAARDVMQICPFELLRTVYG